MTNVQIIQKYYECFNQKSYQELLNLITPDIIHEVNQGNVQVGAELFKVFLDHMDTCYDEHLEDVTVFETAASPQRLAAEFIVNGVYKQTDGNYPAARGQKYRLKAGAFFEIAEGKVKRVSVYYNAKEWIRQVS